MNITLNHVDPVNATITIAVAPEDYQPQIQKALNDIRKNIVIDGFRKGNAPKSRIQAMYGKSVLVDEINKLVSDKLFDYIKTENLNVLGEPLPSAKEQAPLDFDKQESYEFTFDLGLAPEMNVNLTKDDKLPYYTIAVSDEMIEKQINSYKANYGTYDNTIESVEGKDMVKGTLTELDGELTDDGAVLMPSFIQDETEQAKFIGAKKGDVITFNPLKAYNGHEAELASFLKVKKEEVAAHPGDFSFVITEITRYKEAEIGQELFDKVYEPETVTTEEAFREKIKESLTRQLAPEGDYKFILDAKQRLEEKAEPIQFPDEFLKRWLVASDEKRTVESVEEDYPKILKDLKFQLIRDQIIKENDIKIDQEEVQQQAIQATRAQFERYGMGNVPDQMLENYAQEMLQKRESVRNLVDMIMENKLIAVLKEQVTLEPKEVTEEEFQKMFEQI
jgi:trigger factor